MLLVRTLYEQIRSLQTRWFFTDVVDVADNDRVGRIEIGDFVIFNPHARHAVHGGRNDVGIIETDFERAGFDLAIEIELRLAVAQTKMPFADHSGVVSIFAQQRWQSESTWLDAKRSVAIEDGIDFRLLPPSVFTGEHRVAGRGASGRRRVALREADAFRRQPVKVWSFDFRCPSTTHVARPKVVGENDDDVGFGLGFGNCWSG